MKENLIGKYFGGIIDSWKNLINVTEQKKNLQRNGNSIRMVQSSYHDESIIKLQKFELQKAILTRNLCGREPNDIPWEANESLLYKTIGGGEAYNRELAKQYAEAYADKPNLNIYPHFDNFDCTNFVSQVLAAGGMICLGRKTSNFNCWFCNTLDSKELTHISKSWKYAKFFLLHWGNKNGIGLNRASIFKKITSRNFIESFEELYNLLDIGDVLQYGDPENDDYPYHTQIVHDKGYNVSINRNDLLVAQHSINAKGISLYKYVSLFKDNRPIYIYKI